MNIIPVKADSDIKHLAELAHAIWWQHFPPIIGEAQVEYMVNKFQSQEAIAQQLKDGWEYFVAERSGEVLGYTGLVLDHDTRKLQLSKLYVQASARGRGVGAQLLQFIEGKCLDEGLDLIWLTVNRYNTEPIAWYQKRGFSITNEMKMDIGNGFFMDDYIMEKVILVV